MKIGGFDSYFLKLFQSRRLSDRFLRVLKCRLAGSSSKNKQEDQSVKVTTTYAMNTANKK